MSTGWSTVYTESVAPKRSAIVWARKSRLGSVGKLRRRPESKQFSRLAKTAKQAISFYRRCSRMQPGGKRAARSQIEFSDRAYNLTTVLLPAYTPRGRSTRIKVLFCARFG